MEEKLIQLIILMDKVYNEYICDCGCCDDIIENFNYEINKLFSNYPLNDEILMRIKFLDCRIFDENYCYNVNFKNNKFRKQISKFLQTKVKAIKVQFNYNLVYKYIDKDYKLISYLENINEDDCIKLAIKNPKILYLINNISSDMLLKILESNLMASLIIDCDIMLNDELYKNSYLYKNRNKLLQNKQLYNQFMSGIKTYLKTNLMKYLHMSEITRNDVDLAQYILPKEPRLIAYAGKEIYKNKELMIQMIKIDNSYDYYLDDSLKHDKDIISLVEDNKINVWNKIVNHEKLLEVFKDYVDFHDATITKVKYNNDIASITIDCEGFINTMSLFDEKYKQFKNILVDIKFKGVSLFEIDYDLGMNLINELNLLYSDSKFIVTIESYYLKIICSEIIIENISIVYLKSNELLDKYLKSDI